MAQNPRLAAARIIFRVVTEGRSLDRVLQEMDALAPRDAALVREIAYGVIRHFACLQFSASQLMKKPLKRKDQDLLMLILAGLYQLAFMRMPAHAAVSETVAATRGLKKPWARALVNAVLRNYQRNADRIKTRIARRPQAATSHPAWLLRSLYRSWPDQFRNLVIANNSRAPLSLRVNLARGSREDYLARLDSADIPAAGDPLIPCAVTLSTPARVQELPGFFRGDVSVQDKSAQQAGLLLDVRPGMRVLDACAAPGGKTGHLLEQASGGLDLTALDISGERLVRVQENLERLGYSASLIEGDATQPDNWWDGEPYQRILLDAPCSGTGVIRRHPDIRLHRKPADIAALANLQADMLSSLWKLLAPGGKLLYCTCSVLQQENETRLSQFAAATTDARPVSLAASYASSSGCGWQVMTGTNGMDGFYYGCLQKISL